MSFASLKKAASTGNTLSKLTQEIEKLNQPQTVGADNRLWKPELDKSGNGYAVIRFLPAPNGEEMPWAKIWSHSFKGPGVQWYIENSLTTIGKDDPVGELNRELWNSGREQDKATARVQKRKLSYYSNIYVVSDPAHPENEGKVFLYKYGKKIFDKLVEAMQPAFADETPLDPFNLWKGADFKVKIRKVDGYWNYDKSEFASPAPISEDDGELETIYNKQHSLAELIAPDQFLSYDDMKAKLDRVLGLSGDVSGATAESIADDNSAGNVATADETPWSENPEPQVAATGSDESISYFEKLANDQ